MVLDIMAIAMMVVVYAIIGLAGGYTRFNVHCSLFAFHCDRWRINLIVTELTK